MMIDAENTTPHQFHECVKKHVLRGLVIAMISCTPSGLLTSIQVMVKPCAPPKSNELLAQVKPRCVCFSSCLCVVSYTWESALHFSCICLDCGVGRAYLHPRCSRLSLLTLELPRSSMSTWKQLAFLRNQRLPRLSTKSMWTAPNSHAHSS